MFRQPATPAQATNSRSRRSATLSQPDTARSLPSQATANPTMIKYLLLLASACTALDTSPAFALDQSTPWAMHTITTATVGAGTPYRGADGVNLGDVDRDGDLDIATPWEEGDAITIALRPTIPTDPWPTIIVGTNVAAEEAIFADVDHDGRLDVVSASESKKVKVHFAPALVTDPWTTVTISTGLQKWMQLNWVDVDGDGLEDLLAAGKTSPATVGYFTYTCDPRVPTNWTYHPIGPVAWTMSLIGQDVDGDQDTDIILTDRAYITAPVVDKTLWGSRWLEQTPAGWVNHTIGLRTTGEPKFLELVDWDNDGDTDVIDGASKSAVNFISIRTNAGDFKSWTTITIPMPTGVGLYHDVEVNDLDHDQFPDLVISYSEATGIKSGVVWLCNDGLGGWVRMEISGEPGAKYDNLILDDVDLDGDLDVLTSEQVDGLGVVWYENPDD